MEDDFRAAACEVADAANVPCFATRSLPTAGPGRRLATSASFTATIRGEQAAGGLILYRAAMDPSIEIQESRVVRISLAFAATKAANDSPLLEASLSSALGSIADVTDFDLTHWGPPKPPPHLRLMYRIPQYISPAPFIALRNLQPWGPS